MAELVKPFQLRISDSGVTSYRVERIDDRDNATASHNFAAPDEFTELRLLPAEKWRYPVLRSDDSGQKLMESGKVLFDCLFQDEILDHWRALKDAAERIHLIIDPRTSELDSLPWEILADEDVHIIQDEFITFSRQHAAARLRDEQPTPNVFRISGLAAGEKDATHYNEMIGRALPLLESKTGPVRTLEKGLLAECRELAETDAAVVLLVGIYDEAALRVLARSRSLRVPVFIPAAAAESPDPKQRRAAETLLLEEKIPATVSLHKSAAEGPMLDYMEALIEALGRGLTVSAATAEARRHCLLLLPSDLSSLGVRTRITRDVAAVDLDAARQSRLRQKTRAIKSFKLTEDPRLRALKLGRFANMLRDSGEIERAIQTYREAIDSFGEASDPYNEAVALNQLGTLLTYRGRHSEALSPLERAVDIRLKMGTLPEAEMSLTRLAYAANALGDLDRSIAWYKQAAELDRSLMRREPLATVLLRMGQVLKKKEDSEEAEKALRECIAIARDLQNRATILVDAFSYLGSILMSEKRFEEAEDIYRKCTELADELGNREEIALAQNNLGNILQRRGDFEAARESYRKGLDVFAALKQETGMASSLHNLAVVEEKLGDAEEAIEAAYSARELAKKLGNNTLVDVVNRQFERMRTTFGPDRFRKLYNAAQDKTRRLDTDLHK
ncbi:MAG: tetratricopeptide repeat protein [Planctomycetota bacterium]